MQYKKTVGNTHLLKLPKMAFLCSRQVTASAVLRCYDWALDFIINYDIKYRMGKELEGEDE